MMLKNHMKREERRNFPPSERALRMRMLGRFYLDGFFAQLYFVDVKPTRLASAHVVLELAGRDVL